MPDRYGPGLVQLLARAQLKLKRVLNIESMGIERDLGVYRCPHCSAVSANPNDRIARYCGRCHRFADG